MKNIASIIKKAGEMQKQMKQMQTELENVEIKANSGGGLVKVIVSGKGVLKSIDIDESIIKSDEKRVLEDLIVAALNNAKEQVEDSSSKKMKALTGGVDLPKGFNLPF